MNRIIKAALKYWDAESGKFRNILLKTYKEAREKLKKTGILSLIILFICLIIAVLLIGGSAYLQHKIYTPFSQNNNPQIFIISPGETVHQIAVNLEKQELISNNSYFLLYFKELQIALGRKITLKAGQYRLSPAMTIPQILEKLRYGLVMPAEVKLIIPEGYNIFQIAKLLEEKRLIRNKKDFLSFNAGYVWKQQSSPALLPCSDRRVKSVFQIPCSSVLSLEGYLFPDTYRFRRGELLKAIIKKMLVNFEQKTSSLAQINTDKKTDLHRLITLASLLEKEVASYYDRRVVAGILYKRLKAGMPLQVDSSILYAKMLALNNADDNADKRGNDVSVNTSSHQRKSAARPHNPLNLSDLTIDSAYNTYKHKGLPPGPICNPGISSIKAALNPIRTDYWYYLSTKDGKTIFSKTYQEHLRNKEKYLK